MSGISSIEGAVAAMLGGGSTVKKIEAIVEAIVAAAPAIEQGIVSSAPYVQAIVTMIQHGGNPSDDDWAALKARLDEGSAGLADAEAAAQSELSGEAEAETEGNAG